MIYYVFNDAACERFGLPKYAYTFNKLQAWAEEVRFADFIFHLINGQPVFIKNRMAKSNIFSEEDLAIIKLSARQMKS